MVMFIILSSHMAAQEIQPFTWLTGTWEMPGKQGGFRLEEWNQLDSQTLSGRGLKVVGTDTMVLETIRILAEGDAIWYIPTVPDQNNAEAIPFKLVRSGNYEFVFENPTHDFPQRIVYRFLPVIREHHLVASANDIIEVDVVSLEGEGIHFRFTRK
jgi:hypothetical protein